MKVAPEKYELLHFSRRRTDNLQLSLRLREWVLQPKEEVRILGLHYDSKLLWKQHQKIIIQKASKFLSALSRTTFSTRGLPVPLARLVYTAILRSLLSYAVGIWFNPHRKLSNISSLSLFQTKCLKIIGGVFKATPTFLIEGELFLPPLDLYVAVRTIPSNQVRLIGSTGLDSGLVLGERSVKEWVGVLRDSKCGLLKQCFIQDEVCIEVLI